MPLGVRLNLLFLLNFKRCELCPHKDGALKRTDNGGKYFCVEPVCLAVPPSSCPRCNFFSEPVSPEREGWRLQRNENTLPFLTKLHLLKSPWREDVSLGGYLTNLWLASKQSPRNVLFLEVNPAGISA